MNLSVPQTGGFAAYASACFIHFSVFDGRNSKPATESAYRTAAVRRKKAAHQDNARRPLYCGLFATTY
jgi:hypothetical protein